ncbi:hydrolase 1, exosortase A system-associated [Roseateles terrae]|uniref:Exosortase A-associated hydrolase 1 n=1 Tax=Roseateles terrae TaxID=431060 RepID=A0ABR6GP75_9BURK|nr:hydrolase 1, exosortase A system-associated [Roseateles terrae]MBB3193497.1 exosortase A-associated hydrolase 1 [Roseateles terrae]OWQ89328.1 hydrolase 1, exosortase A system-associated [Roseateles terrae]
MNHRDTVFTVDCHGDQLLGILSEPAAGVGAGVEGAGVGAASGADGTVRAVADASSGAASRTNGIAGDLGVLLIVGGPQYRVGCHRQFTLLGRALATGGVPCLRIDYRGMGDATGEARDFEQIDDDIAAAIDHWQRERPGLRRVVIWGLCDAASAALLYVQGRADPRVAGLCLANPWVRTEESLARAQVRHYYWDRLRQGSFWRKLLSGRVGWAAARELLGKLSQARGGASLESAHTTTHDTSSAPNGSGTSSRATAHGGPGSSRAPARRSARTTHYTVRMAEGLRRFPGPVLLMLSGDDLVAKEFLDLCRTGGGAWKGVLNRPRLRREDLPEADHTFASAAWRAQVEAWTLSFATALAAD